MKTKLYASFIAMLFVAGCSNDPIIEDNLMTDSVSNVSIECTKGVVYPLAEKGFSRSTSLESNWETVEKVTLPSGIQVATPWANYASGDIPVDVMRDIKAEDGWELVAHTMTPNNEAGHNYLVFHNYTTGILKVFFYVENYVTNNMGIWRIQFDGGIQKYLNFADQVADPICYDSGRTAVDVTNLTEKTSKGFSVGWNCFQVELAYDPSPACSTMRISAINYNVQNMNLEGEYNSATDGMLISKSTSNPFSSMVNGVANLTGNSAEKWYNAKFGKNLIESNNRSIIAGVVAAGAKLLLNSLVSRFKKETTTTQEIQLKTHGSINLSGTISMENPSPIKSITLNTNALGKLGAWNLSAWPITRIYNHAFLDHIDGDNYYYKVKEGDSYNTCSVVVNPKLEEKLLNKSTSCSLVEYKKGAPECKYNNDSFDRGVVGKMSNEYLLSAGETLFKDDNVEIVYRSSLGNSYINIKMKDYIPSLGGTPMECDMNRFQISSGYGNRNRFMRVTLSGDVSLNNKGIEVTNTKTFLPRYEWRW